MVYSCHFIYVPKECRPDMRSGFTTQTTQINIVQPSIKFTLQMLVDTRLTIGHTNAAFNKNLAALNTHFDKHFMFKSKSAMPNVHLHAQTRQLLFIEWKTLLLFFFTTNNPIATSVMLHTTRIVIVLLE